MKSVVIAGGGISGLAAAFYLQRLRPDLAVTLFEARPRLGGVIATRQRDGFVIEAAPTPSLPRSPGDWSSAAIWESPTG